MGQKPLSSLKVKDYTIYPYQIREAYADGEGFRGINFRITRANQKGKGSTVDIELYDGSGVRIKAKTGEFENGKITGGYSKKIINEFNARLIEIQSLIAKYLNASSIFSKQLIMESLYGSNLAQQKRKRTKYTTIRVDDHHSIELTSKDVGDLLAPHADDIDETGEPLIQDDEDFHHVVNALNVDRNQVKLTANRKAELAALSPEERYKLKDGFDRENIFELLGYVRYGTKKDAAGNETTLLKYEAHQLMSKLLSFRANEKPSELTKDFHETWVHQFYKFIKDKGYDDGLSRKRLSHNPFINESGYKFEKGVERKEYSLNSFGEGIHKHLLTYIKVLLDEGLLKNDFRNKIDANAFAKNTANPKGALSNYDDVINFLEPSEFLKVMHADLNDSKYRSIVKVESELKEKINKRFMKAVSPSERKELIEWETNRRIKELTETKDAFTLAVLLGGLRVSDLLKTNKKMINLASFSMIQFKQQKTGGLVKNVILKPAEKILLKHKNRIPLKSDVIFNRNLKTLFKVLGLDRMINRTEITMKGEKHHSEKLHDIVSSKFARSTYYVLMGVLGEPLDSVIKRTGHSDKAIALKHYYGIGTNYDQKVFTKLLAIFGKKK